MTTTNATERILLTTYADLPIYVDTDGKFYATFDGGTGTGEQEHSSGGLEDLKTRIQRSMPTKSLTVLGWENVDTTSKYWHGQKLLSMGTIDVRGKRTPKFHARAGYPISGQEATKANYWRPNPELQARWNALIEEYEAMRFSYRDKFAALAEEFEPVSLQQLWDESN